MVKEVAEEGEELVDQGVLAEVAPTVAARASADGVRRGRQVSGSGGTERLDVNETPLRRSKKAIAPTRSPTHVNADKTAGLQHSESALRVRQVPGGGGSAFEGGGYISR